MLKKDIPILVLIALPIIYLAYVWNQLPAKVPMHWNIKGEIDRYGNKNELIILILMPLLIYLLLLLIPKIDPKNKLLQMGKKYQALKIILISFTSLLSLFLIYTAKSQSLASANYIVLIVGVLFILLGNYFPTIKANYFIGIRTPWTLENETVWRETHRLGGKMWFIGGILIVLSSLLLGKELNFMIMLIITAILVVVPIVFSYLKFQEASKMA